MTEEPKQYPIGGYAPGFYSCTCVTCKQPFMGDKRAVQCEPCAIETTQESKEETLEEAAEKWLNSKTLLKSSQASGLLVGFIEGAQWQAERIQSIIEEYLETAFISKEQGYMNPKEWFEKYKKNQDE